jgi:ABC-type nitrate/sulfonate/bicarbonate transport system ATPase subunit
MTRQESSYHSRLLRIRDVSKYYAVNEQRLSVLRNVTLDIDAGEFVSVVGASGCGKSTLLRLITGLDTDYDGDILLEGRPIDGPGSERGIVFQEHRLFPWLTVEQNVELGLDASDLPGDERRRRVDSNIELVGLTGFAKAHPHQLSGGMAQRAAIARALVGRPEILLLDEPLGALDSLTRSYLQEELLRIWRHQNVTMIMVTHDVEEAVYLSDRVVVMEQRPGRIRSVVSIDLPRARDRASPDFIALKERVLCDLRH